MRNNTNRRHLRFWLLCCLLAALMLASAAESSATPVPPALAKTIQTPPTATVVDCNGEKMDIYEPADLTQPASTPSS